MAAREPGHEGGDVATARGRHFRWVCRFGCVDGRALTFVNKLSIAVHSNVLEKAARKKSSVPLLGNLFLSQRTFQLFTNAPIPDDETIKKKTMTFATFLVHFQSFVRLKFPWDCAPPDTPSLRMLAGPPLAPPPSPYPTTSERALRSLGKPFFHTPLFRLLLSLQGTKLSNETSAFVWVFLLQIWFWKTIGETTSVPPEYSLPRRRFLPPNNVPFYCLR